MAVPKFRIETGVQLLARLTKKKEIENFYPVLFQDGLKYGDAVEVISQANISHFLIDIICEALYPSAKEEDAVGVLLFNTGGNFVYEQLIKTLQKRIASLNIDSNIQNVDQILHKILKNFQFLEIYDSTQFYVTIHNLDNILMKNANISLLLFDSLTSFYWSEQGFKITKMNFFIKNLLQIIKNVSKEYKVIIIYTRPGYFSSSKDIDDLKTIESVKYRVQLVDNSKEVYKLNVKTVDSDYNKYFTIKDYNLHYLN